VSDRKRGLGRGLGALIPAAPSKDAGATGPSGPSPVDVLIPARTAPAPDVAVDPAPADDVPAKASVPEPAKGSGATPRAKAAAPAVDAPDLAPVEGAYFAEIPITAIRPNPRQPREVFDEEAMAELVHSVREVGLLQPIVVRPLGDDTDMLRDALLENLHRSQLNPLEEAAAYDQLLADFGCTHEELAGRIGRSRPQISNTLRLLRLPPSVQRRLAAGVLSAGHARAVLGLVDGAAQERLAQRIVAEGLSVRTVEEIVALGGEPERTSRTRTKRPVAPKLEVLAHRLGERFETRVKVDLGKSKGRIIVEFASLDDLERIVALMTEGTPAEANLGRQDAIST
jgi:ParB family chromosome partitioning protein